jgi:hypothetical protein
MPSVSKIRTSEVWKQNVGRSLDTDKRAKKFLWKCAAGVPYSRCNFARKNIVNADNASSSFSAAVSRAL